MLVVVWRKEIGSIYFDEAAVLRLVGLSSSNGLAGCVQ